MRYLTAALLTLTGVVFAQQPPPATGWEQVEQLVSGVELRITEAGAKPRTVELYEVRPESLVVIENKQQLAIARDAINRIELRLPRGRQRAVAQAKSTVKPVPGTALPNRTVQGGVTVQSQEGNYLLVYRRPEPPPPAQGK